MLKQLYGSLVETAPELLSLSNQRRKTGASEEARLILRQTPVLQHTHADAYTQHHSDLLLARRSMPASELAHRTSS